MILVKLSLPRCFRQCCPSHMYATQINLHWLQRWCVRVTCSETAPAIADSICNVLLLDKGPDEAAAELLELLGFSAFDEVTALMEQR